MKVKHLYSDDFSNGVQTDRKDIDKWHERVLEILKKEDVPYHMIRSGNSALLGLNYGDEIEIFEFTTGYVVYTYKIKKKK